MIRFIMVVTMSIASCCVTATGLTDGLVGYWSFDGNVKDGSGRGHKLSGSVAYTVDRNGRDNSAAVFDGTTSLKLPQSLYVARSLTVSVWCKPSGNIPTGLRETISETDGATMVGSQYVLYPSHGGFSSTGKAGVGLIVGQNGVIMMEHADGYCPIPLVCYGNIGNNWALVTVTISGNGAPQLYINGDFIKKGMASSKTKFVGASDWSLPDAYPENNEQYRGYYWGAIIGNGATVAYSHCPYYGFMDDFRIYNRALEASEIKSLYEEEVVQLNEVTFDANSGEGCMENETVITGSDLLLPANKFRNNGFVFQGWALSPSGEVVYKDEALITVDSDMTLYAVWAAPALTLVAESADWSSGSIKLRCEDRCMTTDSRYTLFYYDDKQACWNIVDSARDQQGTADGKIHLTDTKFASRLGGIAPVQYQVICNDERSSETCVTRTKHGIFVGVGEFVEDANCMNELAIDKGKFSGTIRLRTSPGAKYSDVKKAFEDVAEKIKDKPGDICVIYFSTHGGRYNKTTIGHLVLDDRPPESEDPKKQGYHEGLLAKHIRLLDPDKKGVGVVCIISACYSGTFLDDDNGLKECSAVTSWCHREDLGENVAWITAANAETTANSIFTDILLDYGWKRGWALKDNKNMMSFLDLFDCAKKLYDPIVRNVRLREAKRICFKEYNSGERWCHS